MRARFTDLGLAQASGVDLTLVRVPNAVVSVFIAGTTSSPILDTIYANATGGATLSNPFTTGTDGSFTLYLNTRKSVKIRIQNAAGTTVAEADYAPVMPAPEDILANIESGVIYLASYAAGVDIFGGVASAQTAINNAILDATAAGAKIVVGPGTVLGTWAPTTGLEVEGAGPSTILKHPTSGATAVWNAIGKTGTHLKNCIIDGNYSNNNGTGGHSAYTDDEVQCSGTGNTFTDVEVINYNYGAFMVAGIGCTWTRCTATGIAASSYPPDTGGSASQDYRSYYGFHSYAQYVTTNPVLDRCKATGTRVGGFFVGGIGLKMVVPWAEDTHRGESVADVTTTVGVANGVGHGNGGGQIAIALTSSNGIASGDQHAVGLRIISPHLGFTVGAKASAIELQDVDECEVIAPWIGQHAIYGVSIFQCVRTKIRGGDLTRASAGGTAGLRVLNSQVITLEGTNLYKQAVGVLLEAGTNQDIELLNLGFDQNTTNYTNSSSARVTSLGHRVASGTALPNILPTGDLTLSAGKLSATASTALAAILNTTAGAAVNGMMALQRSGATKAHIGLTAGDVIALLNAAGTTANLTVDDSGNTIIRGDLTTTGLVYADMATAPTLDQGGAVAATVNRARYKVLGKKIFVHIKMTATAAGVANNPINIVLPSSNPDLRAADTGATAAVGSFQFFRSAGGVGWKSGVAVARTASNIAVARDRAADYFGTTSDGTTPGPAATTLASGDVLELNLEYEGV